MTTLQQSRAEYELSKYFQFCDGESQLLTENAALCGSLRDCIELSILRLGVYGVFFVLNDAKRLHLFAGGHRIHEHDQAIRIELVLEQCTDLRIEEDDLSTWTSMFQEIIASDAFEPGNDLPNLKNDGRDASLAAATGLSSFPFLTGVPLTSKRGHKIGAVCAVSRSRRQSLPPAEGQILANAAQRCMDVLDLAREQAMHTRWSALQEGLDSFLQSHTWRVQLLREAQAPAKLEPPEPVEEIVDGGMEGGLADEIISGSSNPPIRGGESQRVADIEIVRNDRIAARNDADAAHLVTARSAHDNEQAAPDHDNEQEAPEGGTTYRKLFQRAAECLRTTLKADGVLFVDGLTGLHGEVQPVAQPERELEREVVSQVESSNQHNESGQKKSSSSKDYPDEDYPSNAYSRTFTSADYLKDVYTETPAEVIGVSASQGDIQLEKIAASTLGMPAVDEGFLQRILDRHPNGAMWYILSPSVLQVKNENLVETDSEEEASRLATAFKSARQLIVRPLTDPTSRKRLGACFAWRNRPTPIFTESVDVRSMKMFLHVIESETARVDAWSVAKQKETFVSSVSHELRTPLHGILGAVQLLTEPGLDPMQQSLAEMITTCGSTLHETLTSVLSYAKINQFERRQIQYRQRRTPDAVWALQDKHDLTTGLDRDYKGLYICTNLAMLCEDILSVLEAGKNFHRPHAGNTIVVCNIKHGENWNYRTEPGAFRRIAINLIGNALKYTKSGSVVVTLTAAQVIEQNNKESKDSTSRRTITLVVEDTGKGMSQNFMDSQLFLPFTQEDATSTHGVGLGMSIVKSLVSLLGGEIEVQSEEKKGTKISVRIPMSSCTPREDEKGEAADKFDRDIQTIRDRRLSAVIYGFPDYVRESLTNYLCEWFGCDVLHPIVEARPDIILVDEGNPDIDGAVRETAQGYGKRGVLLSIVMDPSKVGKKMHMMDGYIKWVRVPRPLGPNNVAKGLLSCLVKLDDLRKYGEDSSVEKPETEEGSSSRNESTERPKMKRSFSSEQYMPSLTNLQISEAVQTSTLPLRVSGSSRKASRSSLRDKRPDAANEASRRMATPKVQANLEPEQTPHILLVDDNALNLKVLGAFFKKHGYQNVKQAKDGKEAVEIVQSSEHVFNIIFMDLSMPVMDGFEATRQIRKMETSLNHTPVDDDLVIIALTGLASQDDEDAAFDAGVDMFITKPVHFPKLSSLLEHYKDGTLIGRRRPA